MKKILVMFILFVLMLSNNLFSQNWFYLGQEPPGDIPERFPTDPLLANGDWWWHSSPIFSPAGDEMFFVKYYAAQYMEMNYMKVENGEWTEPESPWFVTPNYTDNCPFFSATGDTLYFISTRPGGFIFMTTKENEEWTEPVALYIPVPTGSELGWQFTINKNRDIYFENWDDIYCSRFVNGNYQTPEVLPAVINTGYEFAPYIDPDDNFILFSSNRPGGYGYNDIYISSKDNDGNWMEAINLGPTINSSNEEAFAFISYDNLYFFFTTQQAGDLGYNPYWVDANVIFDMVTDVNDEEVILPAISMNNYPNPFNPSTTISFELTAKDAKNAKLEIYNLKGQEIKAFPVTLSDAQHRIEGSIIWNGKNEMGINVSSGIYLYKLTVNGRIKASRKMILMK